MILKIKYFGMIAEALNKEEEELNVNTENVAALKNIYNDRLKNVQFKVAVNYHIVQDSYQFNENDEVALLPPFAGG